VAFIPLTAAVLLLAVSAALGQGTSPAPAAPPAAKSAPSGAALERAIRARFARSKISADGFTVRVANGIAILEGRTDVPQHKGTATRLARSAGARKVDNRIEVTEQGRQKSSRRYRRPPRRVRVRRPPGRRSAH